MTGLSLYVATHKPIPAFDDPCYIPVQAGAAIHGRLDMPGDATGDNISDRNGYYSELTVHYWIWKNVRASAVGLVHYRRHFLPGGDGFLYGGRPVARGSDLAASLNGHDIVLIDQVPFHHAGGYIPRSLEQQYVADHDGFDLVVVRQVIGDLCPGYLPAFDFVMRNNRLIPCNMLIATRDVFDAYSTWLFAICFAAEGRLPLAARSGYQARAMGFLAERLCTVWVAHNHATLRPAYRGLVFIDGI